MLNDVISKLRPDDKPIVHSAGMVISNEILPTAAKQHGLTQSMSRKGNCLDNAAMESFFNILKSECFYRKQLESIEELEQTVKECIHYYNHDRIKAK